MTLLNSLMDLFRGIKRHPGQTSVYIFSTFSVLNTILSGIAYFIPSAKIEGPSALYATILLSFVIGFIKIWKPSKIEIPVANCNTVIEILGLVPDVVENLGDPHQD